VGKWKEKSDPDDPPRCFPGIIEFSLTDSSMERGISFIDERVKRSRERLAVLNSKTDPKDLDEIWETYYDLEEAIFMAKIIFGGFDKQGRLRRLPDFSQGFSGEEVRAKIQAAERNLSRAESSLQKLAGNETIELLRAARDQAKMILLAEASKGSKRRYSRRKVRPSTGGDVTL
jgi:hypothetical protein